MKKPRKPVDPPHLPHPEHSPANTEALPENCGGIAVRHTANQTQHFSRKQNIRWENLLCI